MTEKKFKQQLLEILKPMRELNNKAALLVDAFKKKNAKTRQYNDVFVPNGECDIILQEIALLYAYIEDSLNGYPVRDMYGCHKQYIKSTTHKVRKAYGYNK